MTTMNTGAASLSDERERAAITACALMIKGICLTRPNAEWTGAIEDRIQFMLKQMQAGAAIAAGGAQEPVAWMYSSTRGVDLGRMRWSDDMKALGPADMVETPLYAAPLPRVAATVPEGFALVPLKPNDAMQLAGAEAIRMDTTALNKIWTANAVFRAMVEAAGSNGEQ
jgi:hypothetical protein